MQYKPVNSLHTPFSMLKSKMFQLLEGYADADVRFKIGGGAPIPAHKLIMSMNCEVLFDCCKQCKSIDTIGHHTFFNHSCLYEH